MGFHKKQTQYFRVGEKVTLTSKSRPEFNGDAVVLIATLGLAMFTCPHCNTPLKNSKNQSVYYLSVFAPNDCCIPWSQDALMKKYKRATKSFADLMKDPGGH